MRFAQTGSSLVALMIAVALSLGIALQALRLLALSGRDYLRTEQEGLLQEQAAYVLDRLRAALQQAGHVDAARTLPALAARPVQGALNGLDDVMLPAGSRGLTGALRGGSHGSDALAIQFSGDASGLMRNCAGMPVAEGGSADGPGWSIFHVGLDRQGEPELRCKFRGDSGWVSQAIATGVVSLQLLYGLDTDDDGLPNDFVSASRLRALDEAGTSSGTATGPASPSQWTRVVAVHVSLLLRSLQAVRQRSAQPELDLDLFGRAYAQRHAGDDPGSTLTSAQLRPDRLYRQFDAVIFLRNSLRPLP